MQYKYFLAKTEPETFSIDDFSKETTTLWDGVHNYQAINIIKQWEVGDRVLIYHSRKERAIVGIGRVIGPPFQNTDDPRYSWAARLQFIKKFSSTEKISLKTIKSLSNLNSFQLVTHSRLSVMKCPEEFITWIKTQVSLE